MTHFLRILMISTSLMGVAVSDEPAVTADDLAAVERARDQSWPVIDLSLFRDGIDHYKLEAERAGEVGYQRYRDNQIIDIAENILHYQLADGGWPKSMDWLRVITDPPPETLRRRRSGLGVFDNRTTYSQVRYLASVFEATGIERYRHACLRGIDYMLQQQRASGGWRGTDVDAITFNDDVTTGVLSTLQLIARQHEPFGFVDDRRRTAARQAVASGIACILQCQILVGGVPTVWCQQHSHEDFRPVKARTYELPSLCAGESVSVVQFLMSLEQPTEEVTSAVEHAVQWLTSAQLTGIRVETIDAEVVKFRYHVSRTDRVVVRDPEARPIWARYYDLQTGQPFFCNRDGVVVLSLAEVRRERRTGYAWYGYWPSRLLTQDYPAWKKRMTAGGTSVRP